VSPPGVIETEDDQRTCGRAREHPAGEAGVEAEDDLMERESTRQGHVDIVVGIVFFQEFEENRNMHGWRSEVSHIYL